MDVITVCVIAKLMVACVRFAVEHGKSDSQSAQNDGRFKVVCIFGHENTPKAV
ncbi:hypothetical protein NGM44_00730 [Moraxella sp. FZFQ2102]|uniref:hypothetical protein n=1 Tax=Moraxella sp. FZFQ2102 TaxID=2953752 RepID=UPI00209BBF09|nr:hypothetical protein [Moraxella sp. FZFQ2102]USZ14959.1 hypothetical protein NGM44_00730 [Moraxella sp. FZFQ2102]